MANGRPALGLALGVAMTACGPNVGVGDDGGSTGAATNDGTTTAPSTTTAGPSTTTTTTSDPTTVTTDATTTGFDDTGDSCGGFYGSFCFDWGGPPPVEECDLDAQDCPEGEKCMPWANDGGHVWNATRCSPLDPDPGQLGEPCLVEGSPVSGIDNCDVGLTCFGVDTDTNAGRCVELCSVYEAQCESPGTTCMYPMVGLLGVCLVECDPLDPQCGVDEGCYPYDEGLFGCSPDGSGEGGTYGDPCTWQTDCASGSLCVLGMHVPACAGVEESCCTDYCDPTAQNDCPDAMQGQSCGELSADPLAGACL